MNLFNSMNRVGCYVRRPRAQPEVNENGLLAASNSRSNNKHHDSYHEKDESKIHVSGKRGWNISNELGLLLLVAFSLLCHTSQADPETCVIPLNEPVHGDCSSQKEQNIIMEFGNFISVACNRNWSSVNRQDPGRRVSDLVIILNNKTVQPSKNSDLDEVSVNLGNLPPGTYAYECRLIVKNGKKEQYEVLYHDTIFIGFKPKKPRSFNCISHNLEKLVCTWDPEPNSVLTRFSLRVSPPGRSSFVCPESQAGSKIAPNSCVWDTSTDPPYKPTDENYSFLLDAENALGNDSFTYNFHHWAHVIPSQPVNLMVLNETYSSALLHWNVPSPMQDFPPGLHYRVSYQAQSDIQNTWHTIDITNETRATGIYFYLTDLEFANTVYNVRVSMKSSMAVGDNMWGQPAEATFGTTVSHSQAEGSYDNANCSCDSDLQTTFPASRLPPRTDVGSFEVVENSENRDLYVYWQRIPGIPDGEDNLPYKVVSVEEDDRILDLQPYELTETYAKFTGIGFNGISLKIAAATYKPADSLTSTVHVPSQLDMPQKPVVHTKIAFDGGIYELSWNPSNNPDITDNTIFWCENARDRPYQCSGHLDWVHVPGDTHVYNITVPDPKKIYQFAIAANTARTSSGMMWFSELTTLSNDVGKPKSVRINRIGSDSVEVGWELPYSGRIGTVEGFNIYYCPVLSSHNCTDPKTKTFVKTDEHLTLGGVRDLKPDTTYKLAVAVLSKNGEGLHSAPLYFATLKAGLNPPATGTTLADICSGPYAVPIDIKTFVEQSFSDIKDYIKELVQQRDEAFDRKLDAAFNVKLDSLLASTKQHDEALDRKVDGTDELKSKITESVTQVSNLTLPISVFNDKLDSVSEPIKRRDKSLDDKLCWRQELKKKAFRFVILFIHLNTLFS